MQIVAAQCAILTDQALTAGQLMTFSYLDMQQVAMLCFAHSQLCGAQDASG